MPATSRRINGRNARLYVGIASSTAQAEPVSYQTAWTLSAASQKDDVTCFGDTNKVVVAGLPDAQGTTAGFYDTASDQLYTAAEDGLPRKMYLYPTISDATYWFGTGLFDFTINVPVSGPAAVNSTWAAASAIIKVNAP